jgi:hypothetical protein
VILAIIEYFILNIKYKLLDTNNHEVNDKDTKIQEQVIEETIK